MKKLFVHIGHQKCGSTAIQQWMNQNENILAELGIQYIKTGRKNGYAHQQLAIDIRNYKLNQNQIFTELKQEINSSQADYFLISAENLIEITRPDVVINLRDRLEFDLEFHLVAIFRNQWSWLPSQWSQLAKLGTTFEDYQTWFERCFNSLRELRYDRICQFWFQYCQPTAIHALSFEDLLAFPFGIVEGFFRQLNLPSPQPELFKIEKINSAPSYQTIVLSQKFFSLLKHNSNTAFLFEPGHMQEREAIYQYINQFAQIHDLNQTKKEWISYQQKLQVYDYYYHYNLDLIARFSQFEFERFFLPPVNNDDNLIGLKEKIEASLLTKLQEYMHDKLMVTPLNI